MTSYHTIDSKNLELRSFGQEFYPYEALRAIKLADKSKASDRCALTQHIAGTLPQPSARTRERIAAKFIQRYINERAPLDALPPALNGDLFNEAPAQSKYFAPRLRPAHCQPFVRLVARHQHLPTQIELLYLRLARVDNIVGALARELFYPTCLQNRAPAGLGAAEFATRNGGQLLTITPQLTRQFILHYAQETWNFSDRATIDRALRVLQGAGLIARQRMTEVRRRPTAFRLADHNVSPVTFAFALYDEFLPHLQQQLETAQDRHFFISRSVLPIADFARTLLLSPAQVEEHLELARRHQLLSQNGDQIRLVFSNLDALVDALLAKAI
jgi:hypothetical protein